MTVGEFKTLLRRAHKRGSALDAELDGAMRRAARWIETNTTLQHMRKRFELSVDAGTSSVDLPQIPIKSVLHLRYRNVLDACNEPLRLKKVSFESMSPLTAGVPNEFYLDGVETLVFNGTFQEDYLIDGLLARYTDFPMQDHATHWLLNHAEALMLTQSMLELGLISRDERTYGTFAAHREDQMRVLQNADYEVEFAGQEISL